MAKEEQKEENFSSEEQDYRFYRRAHRGPHIGGFVILFVGIVFLLNNLGLLPWVVWDQLWRFWPVIIILIGLQMLLGRSFASRIIITLLILFILAGILVYFFFYGGMLIPLGMGM